MTITMLDLSTIVGNLNTKFAPLIADQLNQHAPTLGVIPKRIGDGKGIFFDAKLVRDSNVVSYASGADVGNIAFDTEKPASLYRKRYMAPFVVAGDALAVAALSGPEAYVNLLAKQIQDATRNLGIKLGAHLFGDGTGNSSLDLDGFGAAIANSGTYAGLSRTTYSTWQANVLANGGTLRNLSVDLIRTAEKQIFDACGEMFNAVVMGTALYQAYESSFDTARRYVNPGSFDRLDAGVSQLSYKGVPVIRDVNCTANTVYLLNTNHMYLDTAAPVAMADNIMLTKGNEPIVTADGNTGLQVAIDLLGQTGDAYKGFVKVYTNLVVERPNSMAVIKDVQ